MLTRFREFREQQAKRVAKEEADATAPAQRKRTKAESIVNTIGITAEKIGDLEFPDFSAEDRAMIIEAMTMARPIIAPDHGGATEMIEDGVTGLLFKAGDAQSLAEKIALLHDDPALGETLGLAARQHALKTFAVAEHVTQVQNVYEQLLGTP